VTEDEVIVRKGKRRSPPREPSPDVASIHVPPIHQDVFTHHHHVDHGRSSRDYHQGVPTNDVRIRSATASP
jgi:hypothetical protein